MYLKKRKSIFKFYFISESTHPMLYRLGCVSSLFLGIIMLQDVNNSHKIHLLSGRIWRKKVLQYIFIMWNSKEKKCRMGLSLSIMIWLDCEWCPFHTSMEAEQNVWLLILFSPSPSLDNITQDGNVLNFAKSLEDFYF